MRRRRVLSMWQPWASFVLFPRQGLPVKRFETRAFRPHPPLPINIAIHAAKTRVAIRDLLRFPEYREAMQQSGLVHESHFPLGKIIGVATIVELWKTDILTPEGMPALERALGNYEPGRWAWRLAFATPLPEPIPFRGRQSVLWEIDAATDHAIDEQLIKPLQ